MAKAALVIGILLLAAPLSIALASEHSVETNAAEPRRTASSRFTVSARLVASGSVTVNRLGLPHPPGVGVVGSGAPFRIRLEWLGQPSASVEVSGLGAPIRLGPNRQAMVVAPGAGGSATIGCRIVPEGVQPPGPGHPALRMTLEF